MKTQINKKAKIILLLAAVMFTGYTLKAQEKTPGDKTLSPYFFIPGGDPDTESFPLKSTSAEVNIAGVIADVRLNQTYRNEGKKTIEAIYVFPGSTRAAVYHMVMHIGKREIVAVVQPRDLARKNYEQAKENGQTASLLEQERPNVFTMNVANILPGDEVQVELRYTELLVPEEKVYTFVFPSVTGPRYTGKDGKPVHSDPWAANPYLHEGEAPNYAWNVRVNLSAGMGIEALRSPSHEIVTAFKGRSQATVTLKDKETFQGDRDFILEYKLAGNSIRTGLLLYPGAEENFFLAMVQPPEEIRKESIVPREYIFIVDVSGSMHGFPLDISKKIMSHLIGNLGAHERFNIVTFAGGSRTFSQAPVQADPEHKKQAMAFMNNQQGGGGTELLPALRRAMSIPLTEGYARCFVILTDGYVTVEREAFQYIRENLNEANFFAFGIGSAVNRYIIEGMAHAGMGKDFVVTKPGEAEFAAERFTRYVSTPLLTGINISYKGFNVAGQIPSVLPDLLGERPLVWFGKYDGAANGEITITANGGKYHKTIRVAGFKPAKENAALRQLWAREKIRYLDDYSNGNQEQIKEEVTALGLKYNLLTRYTSFLALDSEIRNRENGSVTVKQPLPLPYGVSNYAVGGRSTRKMQVMGVTSSPVKGGAAPGYDADREESQEISGVNSPELKETLPEFKGGMDALETYLKIHLHVPANLAKSHKGGTVFVRVEIDEQGNVVNVKIIRSFDPKASQEAIRLLKSTSGMWKPAVRGKEKIRGTLFIPVVFPGS